MQLLKIMLSGQLAPQEFFGENNNGEIEGARAESVLASIGMGKKIYS